MSVSEKQNALNLDLPQQQAFINFHNKLSEKPVTTVRFFNRNDYYTVHGADTQLISNLTGNIPKQMGDGHTLSYLCLSKSVFEKVIRELLLIKQYRVEVYVKTGNKQSDWKLEYKGSPGNLSQFEEILFENATVVYTNSVMGIQFGVNKTLAIACVDVSESKFIVCEIADNECFTELEAILAHKSPKECVIPDGNSTDLSNLKNILERNGVLVSRLKRSDFNADDIRQDLNRLLHFQEEQTRSCEIFKETELNDAMGTLQAVVRFLNLCGDESNFNQYKIEGLDLSRYVRLDNAAIYALSIFPEASSSGFDEVAQSSSKNSSLMGILDNCCTNQGKRLLRQWIKQPLRDYNQINERLDVVEYLIKDIETRSALTKECLPRLPDMLLILKKLTSKKANLQDCYKLYQNVCNAPHLISTLHNTCNKTIEGMLTNPIQDTVMDLQKYNELIEQLLDIELIEHGEYFVKSSFDENLSQLAERKQNIEEKMQKLLRIAQKDLGCDDGKIKLECNDQHGYFFRVTLKEEPILRSSKKYRIIDAVKGGVRFTNEKLSELNEDYRTVREDYETQQQEIVKQAIDVAAGYTEVFQSFNIQIAMVDILTSFATVALSAKVPYVRPKIHPEGSRILKLEKVRHPCLERQDHISFIPNSAEFDKDTNTLHIITGPNMCGKSTFIRSIGICVLLAHIGCPVPCEYAEISLVDAILARVGADDCQLKGLSTFMLEMIETSTIVKTATENSLVIIDELGRGTSTYDGCGIASAIVEYLANEVKCFTLFATHFHEIINLSEKYPSISNWHVTAVTTSDSITPLYQIKEGACDRSYGIHCAKMVGFPDDVLKNAENYQKELEHYEGIRYLKDCDGPKKRKIIESGDEIIEETLQTVKNFAELSDEELKNKLLEIKEDILSKNNMFLNGLLQA